MLQCARNGRAVNLPVSACRLQPRANRNETSGDVFDLHRELDVRIAHVVFPCVPSRLSDINHRGTLRLREPF